MIFFDFSPFFISQFLLLIFDLLEWLFFELLELLVFLFGVVYFIVLNLFLHEDWCLLDFFFVFMDDGLQFRI